MSIWLSNQKPESVHLSTFYQPDTELLSKLKHYFTFSVKPKIWIKPRVLLLMFYGEKSQVIISIYSLIDKSTLQLNQSVLWLDIIDMYRSLWNGKRHRQMLITICQCLGGAELELYVYCHYRHIIVSPNNNQPKKTSLTNERSPTITGNPSEAIAVHCIQTCIYSSMWAGAELTFQQTYNLLLLPFLLRPTQLWYVILNTTVLSDFW